MSKLNLVIPALVFIILVLAFGWLRSCEKGKEVVQVQDNTAFRTIISGLQADTTNLRQQLREKRTQMTQDSTKSAEVISGKDKTITRLRATSTAQRPDIQPILDSIPKLQAFVDVQDSTIQELTNINAELNASYVAQVRNLNEQLELHAQVQAKSDEIAKEYELRVSELEKKLKKADRRRRFWRGATLVLGATTAVLILAK